MLTSAGLKFIPKVINLPGGVLLILSGGFLCTLSKPAKSNMHLKSTELHTKGAK